MSKFYLILLTIILPLLSFAQEAQEVYYIMPDKQIFKVTDFAPIGKSIDEQGGKIKLLDTIQRDGNLFINVTVKPKNSKRSPYQHFINKIGDKFPLNDFDIEATNKPMLINFWFTTCPPCIKEIPDLNALKESFGDKVAFYAITFNTKEQVEKFEQKRPVHFNHITGKKKALTKFGVRSFPMNIILDKEGTIKFVSGMVGYDLNEFKYELNKLLLK